MVTPNGGVTVIYRGLYEMVVGGYLLIHTIVNEGFFVVVYLLFI